MTTATSLRSVGRPCSVCGSDQRQGIEQALADGDSISRVSRAFAVGRDSLRRHLTRHMDYDAATAAAQGLDPSSMALRIQAVAQRARDTAEEAQEAGHTIAVLRAGDAELRALAMLAAMEISHERPLVEYEAFRAVSRAVFIAARTNPEVAEAVAAVLDQTDQEQHARGLREQFSETTKGLTP